MSYRDNEKSKVNIARALKECGWKIFGFHEDESDMMVDYYSPAYWNGIATKNGFILVVDNKFASNSGRKVVTRIYKEESAKSNERDLRRLEALKNVTVERGASEQEQETAKKAIEEIQARISVTCGYEEKIDYVYPEYKANPTNYNWHIQDEKGNIITMGKGISNFNFYDFEYDFVNKKANRNMSEEDTNKVTDLYKFIDKVEKAIKNPKFMTVNEGKKVVKEVIKPVPTGRNNPQVGDVIKTNTVCLWLITGEWTNSKGYKCFDYESLGSEKRGCQRLKGASCKRYYQLEKNMVTSAEKGNMVFCKLETVEEVQIKDKWVKVPYITVKEENTSNMIESEEVLKEETKTATEESTKEVNEEQTRYTYTVKEDVDTRDNSKIYLVNVKEKLSKEEYIIVNKYIKSIGGYYSKFKHAFLFKDDPRLKLGLSLEVEKENKENNNINSDNEVTEDIKEVENNTEVKEQGEVINITFNKCMNTIEVRLENKTEETEAILKANGYTWLSFVKAYVIDDNYNNRKFLQNNFKHNLKEAE